MAAPPRGAVGPDRHPGPPLDPADLAESIGTLTDLQPQQDLAKTLQDAVVAARQLFDVDAAAVMPTDAEGQLRWASAADQLAQTIEDNQELFGQGPCMDAFAHARPAAGSPWPRGC